MRILYNLFTQIAWAHLHIAKLFSKKLRLFVDGRKESFAKLEASIKTTDKNIWFHCASLGEFEQGVPIIKEVKNTYPDHKIIVTFFSPSGYENKKETTLADVVIYLPFDTRKNAKKFISIVQPKLVIFVKYEFWPNYLHELKSRNTKTLLVSGLFRENQIFFKPFGNFMRKSLLAFNHFFVQDQISEELLKSIQFDNVTISGDTRFDRVSHQIEQDNILDFVKKFKNDQLCIVGGSTWPEDEIVLLPYINDSLGSVKFIMASHKLDASKIEAFRKTIKGNSVLYSELIADGTIKENLSNYKVLIIDSIGLLTKIYNYADIAYIGGAMGNTGLHNILEAATFGVPIIIGKNFEEFPEAQRLQQLAGLFSINSPEECSSILAKLVDDKNFRSKTGMIAGHYVNSNTGATRIVMDYIKN